jgi:hypothetical protein
LFTIQNYIFPKLELQKLANDYFRLAGISRKTKGHTREKKSKCEIEEKKFSAEKNVSVDLYTCGLTMIRRNSSKRFISSIAFWMPTKYVCTSFSLEKPKKWKV